MSTKITVKLIQLATIFLLIPFVSYGEEWDILNIRTGENLDKIKLILEQNISNVQIEKVESSFTLGNIITNKFVTGYTAYSENIGILTGNYLVNENDAKSQSDELINLIADINNPELILGISRHKRYLESTPNFETLKKAIIDKYNKPNYIFESSNYAQYVWIKNYSENVSVVAPYGQRKTNELTIVDCMQECNDIITNFLSRPTIKTIKNSCGLVLSINIEFDYNTKFVSESDFKLIDIQRLDASNVLFINSITNKANEKFNLDKENNDKVKTKL